MPTEVRTRTRKRRRVNVFEKPTSLEDLAGKTYAAKLALDKAKEAYAEAHKAMKECLEHENREEYTLVSDGERPQTVFSLKTRSVGTVDPKGFYDLVQPDYNAFFEACSVTMSEAKKVVGETALVPITTEKRSNPYLDVRITGRSK